MRFKDQRNKFYVVNEGEWVHNGTGMVQATRELTSILVRPSNQMLLVAEQVFIMEDAAVATNPLVLAEQAFVLFGNSFTEGTKVPAYLPQGATAAIAVTSIVVEVTYVDEGTEGLAIPTTPGPNEECCEQVSQGLIAACATKTEVTVT